MENFRLRRLAFRFLGGKQQYPRRAGDILCEKALPSSATCLTAAAALPLKASYGAKSSFGRPAPPSTRTNPISANMAAQCENCSPGIRQINANVRRGSARRKQILQLTAYIKSLQSYRFPQGSGIAAPRGINNKP